MTLYREVYPLLMKEMPNDRDVQRYEAEQRLLQAGVVAKGDLIVLTYGDQMGLTGGTNTADPSSASVIAKPPGIDPARPRRALRAQRAVAALGSPKRGDRHFFGASMHARINFTEIEEHPLRDHLNNEFHARAPIPLAAPVLVSHLAFHHDGLSAQDERENALHLCQTSTCRFVENSATHLMFDAGSFQMRWELHTEYSSYTFVRPLLAGEALHPDATALDAVLPDWLAAIPGKLIVATHVELRSTADVSPESVLAGLSPTAGRPMVVSRVANGAAWVFTDFVFDNGFSRFLLLDETMAGRQPSRAVQRLFEIETYRMLALLGLPIATEVGSWLNGAERRLAELMDHIGQANSPEDERAVLADLSKMAAEVEHSVARTDVPLQRHAGLQQPGPSNASKSCAKSA